MMKNTRELKAHTVMDDTAAITAFRSASVRIFPAQNESIQAHNNIIIVIIYIHVLYFS